MSDETETRPSRGAAEGEALLTAWDEVAEPSVDAPDEDHQDDRDDEPSAGASGTGPEDEDPWAAVAASNGRAGDLDADDAEDARQRRRDRWDQLRAKRREAIQQQRAGQSEQGEKSEGGQSPQATPLAPYRDPRIQQQLDDDPEGDPEWLGMRWREIPPEQQQQAWIGLRKWVDWLVREYRITAEVVPACWYRHSDITAELWAAMNMEHKVWAEGAPSLSPMMMWHPNLEQMIVRLREKMSNVGCKPETGHQQPLRQHPDLEPFEINYDEDDWKAATSGHRETRMVERPDAGAEWVRVVAFDAEGEQIAESNLVGLGASLDGRDPQAVVRFGSLADETETELWLDIERGLRVAEVQWQVSSDGESWEPLPDPDPAEDTNEEDEEGIGEMR